MKKGVLTLLLALLAAVVFWKVRGNAFVNYDDTTLVTKNEHVLHGMTLANFRWAMTTLDTGNWYPLTWLSHMLDVELFQLVPAGHHLMNLAWHSADTALVFLCLSAITGATWRSAFVSALFGVHPLHVEAVAWISGRKEVLCAFFQLVGFLAYCRYTRKRRIGWYWVMATCFAFALMAKPVAVTFPVLLLVLDYWPLGRFGHGSQAVEGGGRFRALLLEKLPLLLVALIASAVAVEAQARIGALASLNRFPLPVRLGNALLSCVSYVRKTVLPQDFAVFYPHPGRALPLGAAAVSGLLLIVTTGVLWRCRRKCPAAVVGWWFFLVGLAPTIGLFQTGAQAMADRYMYLPIIGLFLIPAWMFSPALLSGAFVKGAMATVVSMMLAAYSMASIRQIGYWKTSASLFSHAIDVTQGNYVAHVNLANLLVKQDQFHAALSHYEQALNTNPNLEEAHLGAGNVFLLQGNADRALREYRNALAVNPGSGEGNYNAGLALLQLGETAAAVGYLEKAVRALPAAVEPLAKLGGALVVLGKTEDAERFLRQAIALRPDHIQAHSGPAARLAEAYNNLGRLLAAAGRLDEAAHQYEEALRLAPNLQAARPSRSRVDP